MLGKAEPKHRRFVYVQIKAEELTRLRNVEKAFARLADARQECENCRGTGKMDGDNACSICGGVGETLGATSLLAEADFYAMLKAAS